ncbi:MAG TPA: alpha/beta fold hydrolase [Acidimicrobiales bacterium]|nr:alpha/beta fold hydrolase [Acidimicrobiales bacterium]
MGLLEVAREGSGPTLVWLHGFTQTRDSARRYRSILATDYEVLSPDLPGHGSSAALSASLEETADLVAAVAGAGPLILGGYSMGARVALHVALRHPSLVSHLVLVSATAGIEDASERAARRDRDEALARRIERLGVPAFLEEWLAQPLFATLPRDPVERAARSTDAAGLADSLRRAGTGTQRWLLEDLARLDVPTVVIAGARDAKFVEAGTRLAGAMADARLVVLDGLGHAAHLEDPAAVAGAVADFLA